MVPEQSVYFRTSINDEACFGVAELVLIVRPPSEPVLTVSVGWCVITMFLGQRVIGTQSLVRRASSWRKALMRADGRALRRFVGEDQRGGEGFSVCAQRRSRSLRHAR